MAILTKKDLLETIEDIPMDAKLQITVWDYGTQCTKWLDEVSYDEECNIINLE